MICIPNHDVQMGDVVVVKGAQYRITDEPVYVRDITGQQMIAWELEAVPAGIKTGIIRGTFCVWPTELINVVI